MSRPPRVMRARGPCAVAAVVGALKVGQWPERLAEQHDDQQRADAELALGQAHRADPTAAAVPTPTIKVTTPT